MNIIITYVIYSGNEAMIVAVRPWVGWANYSTQGLFMLPRNVLAQFYESVWSRHSHIEIILTYM